MNGLTLQHVSKTYKKTGQVVIRDIDLHVADDEFLVILGPSGCGKTTLLRIIAGLEKATEGDVLIDGESVSDWDPEDRGIGMVFQNYALFPHMTIHGNLSFVLKTAWYKRAEKETAINKVADKLDIRRLFRSKPYELSGGERQRSAMARAMVNDCRLYLFDEPLSNLDANLRSRLRPEIMKLFRELHVPFLYVTHDQTDAMTMGTKIVVLKEGLVQQIGTPLHIYDHPANMFVAGFVGTGTINFITVDVIDDNGPVVKIGDVPLRLPGYADKLRAFTGRQVVLGIRPEDILTSPEHEDNGDIVSLKSVLRHYEYLGQYVHLSVDCSGYDLNITAPAGVRARLNQGMNVFLDCRNVHVFDPDTELHL